MRGFLANRIGINKPQLSESYYLDVSGNVKFDGLLNMNNQTISNVGTAVNSSDAINKIYLDTSLSFYATNASVNLAFYSNASLGLANNIITNTSLGNISQLTYALNSSIGNYATNASVNNALITNVSIGTSSTLSLSNNASIGILDASMKQIYPLTLSLNSSIGNYALTTQLNLTDTSLFNVNLLTAALNASMGSGLGTYATNVSVNNALLTNVSIGLAFNQYANASLGLAVNIITNTSLGNVSQLAYANNVSIGSLTTQLGKTDTSLYNNFITNVSIGLAFSQYANASLGLAFNQYTNASLGNVSQLTYALNASMGPGLGTYATNASVNLAITNFATNASVNNALITNVSIGSNSQLISALNTSIGNYALITQLNITDTSLYNTKQLVNALNASMGSGLGSYATNASVNLAFYSNASLGLVFNIATNASLGNISQLTYAHNASIGLLNASLNDVLDAYGIFIPEASLNKSYLVWNAGLLETSINSFATNSSVNLAFYSNASLGLVFNIAANTSLGNVSQLVYALNASTDLYATNSSVNNAFVTNVSLGLVGVGSSTTLAALTDVSITGVSANNLLQYDSSFGKWMNVSPIDACSYFYTKSQVDASFALLTQLLITDTSLVNLYATNASVNYAFASNASLGASGFDPYSNASLGLAFNHYTDVSLGNVSQLTYAHNASINALNASLNDTFLLSSYVNTSEYYDGSLNNIRLQFYSNASLGLVFNIATNASLGNVSQLTYANNTSIGLLEASIGDYVDAYGLFIPEVSLNYSKFKWSSGLLEPSVAGSADTTIIEASLYEVTTYMYKLDTSLIGLYATNSSVNNAFVTNVSLGLVGVGSSTTLAALTDVSIVSVASNNLLQYDSSFGKWMNVTPIDACSYFYTKTQVDASFVLLTQLLITDTSLYLTKATYISNASLNENKFKWDGGLLEPSLATAGASVEYVDGSINALYAQIIITDTSLVNLYATNASVNYAIASNASLGASGFDPYSNASLGLAFNHYTDSSLGNISQLTYAHNASINALNASLNDTFLLSSYVNTSEYYDGSLNNIRLQFYSNASLGLVFNIATNASLGNVSQLTYAHNASINAFNASLNDVIDAYGIFIPEVSLNDSYFKWSAGLLEPSVAGGGDSALVIAINTSVGLLEASIGDYVDAYGLFIPEVSLNDSYFKWSSGLLEPSVAGSADTTIIEASLYEVTTYMYKLDTSVNNLYTTNASVNLAFASNASLGLASNRKNIGLIIDGAGSAVTTGQKGYREIDDNYTISGWTLLADTSGSIVIDVKCSSYTLYPETTSIAGTEKPTLTSAIKNSDNSLTSWTSNVSIGDILEFVVDSADTLTKVWLFINMNTR